MTDYHPHRKSIEGMERSHSLVPCAMLASCREGVLDPQGPIGLSERVILSDATAIMLAVVIPVIVLTLVFAWWFRADNPRAVYKPDWEYSGHYAALLKTLCLVTVRSFPASPAAKAGGPARSSAPCGVSWRARIEVRRSSSVPI